MAASIILVEAQPRNPADASAVTVRVAGGGATRPYFYGGFHWRAGIQQLPASITSLDFDDTGAQLGGGGIPQALQIAWSPATNAALAEVSGLFWNDAPITVRFGAEGDALPPIDTTGLVLDAQDDQGVLTISLADLATDLKRPLLVDRFAGTGGIEGPAGWQDTIKTRAWGPCFNVPGKVVDAANDIWCFGDPRRPWKAFVEVRDRGVAPQPEDVTLLAWAGSAEATFAALQAAQVNAGGCVLCPSIACVKWWTEPSGDLHADINGETDGGYVETAPEIIVRILAARSTLSISPGELAAALAARPAPFGWRCSSDSVTAAAAISEIAADVALSWVIQTGSVVLRRWEWSAPVRRARSLTVSRDRQLKPVVTRKLGYRRNQEPMARGDLAAIVLASDVQYGDGTPVENLKPAAPGADVTGDNTANDTKNIYGRPVSRVVDDLDLNGRNWVDLSQTVAANDALSQARAMLNGLPIGTVLSNFQTQFQDGLTAIAELFSLLGAKSGDNSAWNLNLNSVKVAPDETLAQRLSSITATAGAITGTINDLKSVMIDAQGNITAKAVLALDVNGRVSGIVATNNGNVSTLELLFDAFNFLTPDGTSLFYATGNTVRMPNVEVDTLKANVVQTTHLVADAVSGLTTISATDKQITPSTGEVTIIETGVLQISDSVDGKAQAMIAFDQDALASNDAGIQINVYLDTGSGYQLIRTRFAGIGTGSGDTFWRFPVAFAVPIITSGTAKIKVTAKANRLSGKFSEGGGSCWVRSPEITVMQWSR